MFSSKAVGSGSGSEKGSDKGNDRDKNRVRKKNAVAIPDIGRLGLVRKTKTTPSHDDSSSSGGMSEKGRATGTHRYAKSVDQEPGNISTSAAVAGSQASSGNTKSSSVPGSKAPEGVHGERSKTPIIVNGTGPFPPGRRAAQSTERHDSTETSSPQFYQMQPSDVTPYTHRMPQTDLPSTFGAPPPISVTGQYPTPTPTTGQPSRDPNFPGFVARIKLFGIPHYTTRADLAHALNKHLGEVPFDIGNIRIDTNPLARTPGSLYTFVGFPTFEQAELAMRSIAYHYYRGTWSFRAKKAW